MNGVIVVSPMLVCIPSWLTAAKSKRYLRCPQMVDSFRLVELSDQVAFWCCVVSYSTVRYRCGIGAVSVRYRCGISAVSVLRGLRWLAAARSITVIG